MLANIYNMLLMQAITIGERIRKERERKKISLRKFAKKLGISAAYLVDIEKNRRLPKEQILQKTADLLDIPVSAFDEYSPEIPKPVMDWLQNNSPLTSKVLSFLKKAPEPEKAFASLERYLEGQPRRRYSIAIYESELQAIGLESAAWDKETGGDLFGIWGDIPIIYLATRAGPKAKRDHAHFRLDVDYLIRLSILLEKEWGLRYFGDWHSHHSLGLLTPSNGDQRRIEGLAAKNNFAEMAEFIITFSQNSDSERKIEIHPYVYLDLPSHPLQEAVLIVLKGISPVRSALTAGSDLPEQELDSFSSMPTERISIPVEPLGRVPGTEGLPAAQISERLLTKTMSELATMSSGELELYREFFGFVIIVPVNDKENIAFAFDKEWPHALLQVDWMDRECGSSEELPTEAVDASLLHPEQLKMIVSNIKESRTGARK